MAFRLGLTRDLLTPSGAPSFGAGALEVLTAQPDLEWEYLPESLTEITPAVAARYDGLYVNSPQVTATSMAGADCRVRIVARHGVGYDSVDVSALAARGITVTNTPVAVRRPVAVASLTLIFALAGRLFAKDKLIRAGRWHERTGHMGLGHPGGVEHRTHRRQVGLRRLAQVVGQLGRGFHQGLQGRCEFGRRFGRRRCGPWRVQLTT